MVERLKPPLVLEWVVGGMQTVLGGSVRAGLGQKRHSVHVCVPSYRADRGGSGGEQGGPGREQGGRGRVGRGEAGLYDQRVCSDLHPHNPARRGAKVREEQRILFEPRLTLPMLCKGADLADALAASLGMDWDNMARGVRCGQGCRGRLDVYRMDTLRFGPPQLPGRGKPIGVFLTEEPWTGISRKLA